MKPAEGKKVTWDSKKMSQIFLSNLEMGSKNILAPYRNPHETGTPSTTAPQLLVNLNGAKLYVSFKEKRRWGGRGAWEGGYLHGNL